MSEPGWEDIVRAGQASIGGFFGTVILSTCPDSYRVHLLYVHNLRQRQYGNQWPSLDEYVGACGAMGGGVAGDFAAANLLWRALAGISAKDLPNLLDQPELTDVDGGTLLRLSSTIPGPGPVALSVQLPISWGALSFRRACLSISGQPGIHRRLGVGELSFSINYPECWRDDVLRILSLEPDFALVIKHGDEALSIDDPWGWSPVGRYQRYGWKLYDGTANYGTITRMNYQGTYLYGLQYHGMTTTFDLADTYGTSLGHSRRIIFRACRDIEGACESVVSYDGPKLSWGINQWNRGELWQVLAYISDFYPDAFERCFGAYGIRVVFSRRNTSWTAHGTYSGVIVYRVTCCGSKVVDAFRLINESLSAGPVDDRALKHDLAQIFALNQNQDTTSYAMHVVFARAGADEQIRKAQAEWMSFRITSTNPTGKTVDRVLDQFLISLGSSIDSTVRLEKARAALGDEADQLLAEIFSDDDAAGAWVDWSSRLAAQ